MAKKNIYQLILLELEIEEDNMNLSLIMPNRMLLAAKKYKYAICAAALSFSTASGYALLKDIKLDKMEQDVVQISKELKTIMNNEQPEKLYESMK